MAFIVGAFCKENYYIMTTTTNRDRFSTFKCVMCHMGLQEGKESKARDTLAPTLQQPTCQGCHISLRRFLTGSGYGYRGSHWKAEGHEMKWYQPGLSSWVDLFHLAVLKQNRTNNVNVVHLLSHCKIIWQMSKIEGPQTQLDCTLLCHI